MQAKWNLQNNVWWYREKCFSQKKLFINWLNKGLTLQEWVKTHWLSSKENVLGTVVSKEGHAGSFDFIEKGATKTDRTVSVYFSSFQNLFNWVWKGLYDENWNITQQIKQF